MLNKIRRQWSTYDSNKPRLAAQLSTSPRAAAERHSGGNHKEQSESIREERQTAEKSGYSSGNSLHSCATIVAACVRRADSAPRCRTPRTRSGTVARVTAQARGKRRDVRGRSRASADRRWFISAVVSLPCDRVAHDRRPHTPRRDSQKGAVLEQRRRGREGESRPAGRGALRRQLEAQPSRTGSGSRLLTRSSGR